MNQQDASQTRPESVAGVDISGPTLQWLSVESPQHTIPIGDGDYVLDSHFNAQYDTWEVLVLVDAEREDVEDDEDEE